MQYSFSLLSDRTLEHLLVVVFLSEPQRERERKQKAIDSSLNHEGG